MELGPEKFQIRFQAEEDLERVLLKGPYHFKRWMLLLQKWEPVVSENFPSSIFFWIRIHDIPLHFWNDCTVTTIGDVLGNRTYKIVEEAKVRVEFNGLLPLEMAMDIQLPSEEIISVEFEYIKIEKHCFTCFSLFHEETDCRHRDLNAPHAKNQKLGITQRLALQRIEARPMITVTRTLTIELIQEISLLRYLRRTDDSRGMRMNATEYLTPVDPDAQEELIPVFYLAA
ncbi:hypothetical protein F2Q70_00001550 [Brassica cretica]|uniref:DUF4283 domain-containing protein n=1 Tax=Brassica cretica TaxID=69181 RepID=A0A8S9IQ40_BRACR|nr:hypothetical protein F2Q70_00001550 [Brassica cretica]